MISRQSFALRQRGSRDPPNWKKDGRCSSSSRHVVDSSYGHKLQAKAWRGHTALSLEEAATNQLKDSLSHRDIWLGTNACRDKRLQLVMEWVAYRRISSCLREILYRIIIWAPLKKFVLMFFKRWISMARGCLYGSRINSVRAKFWGESQTKGIMSISILALSPTPRTFLAMGTVYTTQENMMWLAEQFWERAKASQATVSHDS